jgi:drug/metabolite transporter (DMT)-like permease
MKGTSGPPAAPAAHAAAPRGTPAAHPAAPPSSAFPQTAAPLDTFAILWMTGLTMVWGVNALSIKIVTQGMAPIMATGLRGLLALGVLTVYGLWRGEKLGFRGAELFHSAVNGLVFAVEFCLFYTGARATSAGHIAIFINTAPFFVAIGAHYVLPGDRMHVVKALGLALALAGIAVMFSNDILVLHSEQWRGDLLVLGGAMLWGLTTLYAKRYMVHRMSAFRILYGQILVSTPALLAVSLALEPAPFFAVTALTVWMIVFQACVAVSFTYLMWTVLLRTYSASAMQSFTFLTPAWGVLLGVWVLGEEVQALTVAGIACIGVGIYLVNRPRKRRRA